MEKATFAAGCFWGVEHAFARVDGVLSTRVGYAGGHVIDPDYHQVCMDSTGHAEAVELDFEPEVVSYKQLLELFFQLHDPTTLNRQGPDVGSQYRSAIFIHGPEQESAAHEVLVQMQNSGRFSRSIVTEITPATTFYPAEEYHQKYLQKRGMGSCHIG